ncbi:MAG: hypothetical protein MUF06_22230 [Pirellulaceae bacterium]|nr:hypothetical protein [Pirellulaceae bacterium]
MRFATRFTLRDLFFVIALAAVGCAWWLEHRRYVAVIQKHEAAKQLWESRANAAADVLTGEGWIVTWDESRSEFELPGSTSTSYSVGSSTYGYRHPEPGKRPLFE